MRRRSLAVVVGAIMFAAGAPNVERDKPENLESGYYLKMLTTGNIRVDFNGDGKSDIAAYDPASGAWLVYGKGEIAVLGGPDAWPVPGDYDGDKKTEVAVFFFETGRWEIKGVGSFVFGGPEDYPVPGDYDGDGAVELATYSPITCLWHVLGRPAVKFGAPGDVPLVRGN